MAILVTLAHAQDSPASQERVKWAKFNSYYGFAAQASTTSDQHGYAFGGGGSLLYRYRLGGGTGKGVFVGGLGRLDIGLDQMKDPVYQDTDIWFPLNFALGFAGGYQYSPRLALACEYEFLTIKGYSTLAMAGSSWALSGKTGNVEASWQVEKSGLFTGAFQSVSTAFIAHHFQVGYLLPKQVHKDGLVLTYQRSKLMRGMGATDLTHENRLIVSVCF